MSLQPAQDNKSSSLASGVTVKAVAKHALLPGVFPRLRRIAGHLSGFLFMFTQLFGAVGLIDRNHPCLRPENIGQYKFTDIIGLAWSNVVFDKKHIPQAVMFTAIIMSLVLMIVLALITVLSLGTFVAGLNPAHAQFFDQPTDNYLPDQDWSFQFLTRIFGDTGLNVWNYTQGGTQAVNPLFTTMLIGMFRTYSLALLIIASFMIIYLLVITVAESARTGEPFGSRFDSVWAPIRLAIAIALLVPMGSGYNGGQMIAFTVSEWGSNLATNIWHAAVGTLANANGKTPSFIVVPRPTDDAYGIITAIMKFNVCAQMHNKIMNSAGVLVPPGTPINDEMNEAWLERNKELVRIKTIGSPNVKVSGNPMATAYRTVGWGTKNNPDLCGSIKYKAANAYRAGASMAIADAEAIAGGPNPNELPIVISKAYFSAVTQISRAPGDTGNASYNTHTAQSYYNPDVKNMFTLIDNITTEAVNNKEADISDLVAKGVEANMMKWVNVYRNQLGCNTGADPTCEHYYANGTQNYDGALAGYSNYMISRLQGSQLHGWLAAGDFYLGISRALRVLNDASESKPEIVSLPKPMKLNYPGSDGAVPECMGTWRLIKNYVALTTHIGDFDMGAECLAQEEVMNRINHVLELFQQGLVAGTYRSSTPLTTNIGGPSIIAQQIELSTIASDADTVVKKSDGIKELLSRVFLGISKPAVSSTNLMPIASLIDFGQSLLNRGGIAYALAAGMGFFTPGGASILKTVGDLFIVAGFALTVALPFFPFMYFFFAVLEWMISIFEAVIGMPLWALSFISLEGDALGRGKQGVMMLFEIMLRPTIIIIALLGSFVIFNAAIGFINDAFGSYRTSFQNNLRSNNSSFFIDGAASISTSVLYVFLVWSVANSVFKLIDSLPNTFMRWIGDGVQGFGSGIKAGMGNINEYILANQFKQVGNSIAGAGSGHVQRAAKRAEEKARKQKEEQDRLARNAAAIRDYARLRTGGDLRQAEDELTAKAAEDKYRT